MTLSGLVISLLNFNKQNAANDTANFGRSRFNYEKLKQAL
jgi:hypothetical protein